MLRISHFIRELVSDSIEIASESFSPVPSFAAAPVVIWNLTRRCNLSCKYCYASAADRSFPNELTTCEALTVLEELHAFGVQALILSGGEPLFRADCFTLARHAKKLGFHVTLSSNGTLLDERTVETLKTIGIDDVGVSLDGIGTTHDRIRGSTGAFAVSLAGLQRCRDYGLKTGLRFTLTSDNGRDLPVILDLFSSEKIDRFYLSHLNYAGRGHRSRGPLHAFTRQAVERLFTESLRLVRCGSLQELVTGNNDADGVYLLLWVKEHFPGRTARIETMLRRWGGNASGLRIANIDATGTVHPDTMWGHYRLGNVLEQPFSRIWRDSSDPLLMNLRRRPRPVTGRCGICRYLDLCNGNARVRAWRTFADPWAEDPGCYLTDAEISYAS